MHACVMAIFQSVRVCVFVFMCARVTETEKYVGGRCE